MTRPNVRTGRKLETQHLVPSEQPQVEHAQVCTNVVIKIATIGRGRDLSEDLAWCELWWAVFV